MDFPAVPYQKDSKQTLSRRRTAEGVSAPLVCGECGKKFKRKVTPTSTPKCPQCGSYDVDADYDDPGSDVFFASRHAADDVPVDDELEPIDGDLTDDEVVASFLASLQGKATTPIVDRVARGRYLMSWLNDTELAGRYDRG